MSPYKVDGKAGLIHGLLRGPPRRGGTREWTMIRALKTPPSDLTRIAARNGGTFPTAHVQRIISGEGQIAAAHGARGHVYMGSDLLSDRVGSGFEPVPDSQSGGKHPEAAEMNESWEAYLAVVAFESG